MFQRPHKFIMRDDNIFGQTNMLNPIFPYPAPDGLNGDLQNFSQLVRSVISLFGDFRHI